MSYCTIQLAHLNEGDKQWLVSYQHLQFLHKPRKESFSLFRSDKISLRTPCRLITSSTRSLAMVAEDWSATAKPPGHLIDEHHCIALPRRSGVTGERPRPPDRKPQLQGWGSVAASPSVLFDRWHKSNTLWSTE